MALYEIQQSGATVIERDQLIEYLIFPLSFFSGSGVE